MNQQDLVRLETEAAEVVGAMRDLFREFERHLGEVVSAQRMAATEARAEGATVIKDIHELRTSAGILVREQRDLLARIEKEWQLRIDQTAQRAGEAQAQAFGESITRGLQAQITALGSEVKRATQATQGFAWKTSLRWVLGIALAIPLTVSICVSALSPHDASFGEQAGKAVIPNMALTSAQTQEAVAKLSLCHVPRTDGWHVCVEAEDPPRVGFGEDDKARVVVRGM
jgi:HPt (histidine-containing phosphotransfer) domain-containing protein